jgi:hypothetical protein
MCAVCLCACVCFRLLVGISVCAHSQEDPHQQSVQTLPCYDQARNQSMELPLNDNVLKSCVAKGTTALFIMADPSTSASLCRNCRCRCDGPTAHIPTTPKSPTILFGTHQHSGNLFKVQTCFCSSWSRTTTDVDYRHAQPVYFVCPGQESNTILHWNRRRDAGVRALEIPSCLVPQKRNHCCGAIPPRIFDRASLSNFDWC